MVDVYEAIGFGNAKCIFLNERHWHSLFIFLEKLVKNDAHFKAMTAQVLKVFVSQSLLICKHIQKKK